ncbi:hypothetical protein KIN20_006795 [Parelaphostrongylus tenuis]|uniref:Uncharacterized protein n=1 Tax=Parelaphostrongylus tenuis TaxID=148309 RepID=A0AAD5MNJ6_PARTN|nr:hypothetical protein KIN20_006795 [Parelaphostrongylus tenuis]
MVDVESMIALSGSLSVPHGHAMFLIIKALASQTKFLESPLHPFVNCAETNKWANGKRCPLFEENNN